MTNAQLRGVNRQFENDFDATLRAALDGTLTLSGKALDRLQCDVALAYGLRNNGAHNTGSAAAVWNRFSDVEQNLFRVLLATVDYLY